MDEDEREALLGLLTRLERRWVLPIPDGDVWHAYDPLPFWHFLDGIRQASAMTDCRVFLDLGCGIGSKLALMHHLGWAVHGVDHHRPYVQAARELVPEAAVEHADIRDLDRLDADLVYMYRPARSDQLETELEQHVLERVAPGTVMFWPLRHHPEVWAA